MSEPTCPQRARERDAASLIFNLPGSVVIGVVDLPLGDPDTGTCPDLLPLAIGAEYVDVWTASAGHDICADDPWVNRQLTDQDADAGLRYHPLAAEQRAVAGLILDML